MATGEEQFYYEATSILGGSVKIPRGEVSKVGLNGRYVEDSKTITLTYLTHSAREVLPCQNFEAKLKRSSDHLPFITL